MCAQLARGVVGRLMADPAFAQKLLIEEAITICASLAWEVRQRRERFGRELDFVAINTLSLAAATGALVWLVSPNRSVGALHKFSWQNYLHRLPNHVFDASTPLNRLTAGARAAGFVAKAAELCAVGTVAGAAMSGLAQARPKPCTLALGSTGQSYDCGSFLLARTLHAPSTAV